ncbi:MAG: hypothetical protein ABI406_16050, partial [Ktedonobacteraceae bacterium]
GVLVGFGVGEGVGDIVGFGVGVGVQLLGPHLNGIAGDAAMVGTIRLTTPTRPDSTIPHTTSARIQYLNLL